MREQLIEYFGDQEVWVDAHDEETAQELVDWIGGEIGNPFGSVHRSYTEAEGFWQYICTIRFRTSHFLSVPHWLIKIIRWTRFPVLLLDII